MKNIIESIKDVCSAIKFLILIVFLILAYPFYSKPVKEGLLDILEKDD